jgi:hypothetical protein
MFAKSIILSLAFAGTGLVGCVHAADDKVISISTAEPRAAVEKTTPFKGAKANTGYATLNSVNGKRTLTASSDFVIPNAPAPHWQVVDSQGNVYLLQQLKIKDSKTNRSIVLPTYIPDVARVQVWCSWAEALLGEASFEMPVK